MKIAIIAAMKEELAPFRAGYDVQSQWQRGKTVVEAVSDHLLVVESGIGKANAAACSAFVCEVFRPDLIINTGSTGSFRPEIAIGDVVYTDYFQYSDVDATGFGYQYGQVPQMPATYPVPSEWLTRLSQLLATLEHSFTIHRGTIVTADSFMSDVALVNRLKLRLPHAVASDMESAAIAQIAAQYDIPVLNIRGISDYAGIEATTTFRTNLEVAALHAQQTVQYLVKTLLETQDK